MAPGRAEVVPVFVVARSAILAIVTGLCETVAEPLLLAGVGSKVLELLNAMLVKEVPSVVGTLATIVRVTLVPLAKLAINGQVTAPVAAFKVPVSLALTKVKPAGRGS